MERLRNSHTLLKIHPSSIMLWQQILIPQLYLQIELGLLTSTELLIHGTDYKFESPHGGFVTITKTKAINDVIEIFEYENTDGSYIPNHKQKLGFIQICS